MIVEYLATDEPLTLDEVKAQCRLDGDAEDAYLSGVIIPGARALAESKSGSAIRAARYSDTVQDVGSCVLSMGGVTAVESVKVDGVDVAFTDAAEARRTYITAPGSAGKKGVITYTAGIDIDNHPGARAWMLLICGWLYAQREMLVGTPINEPPPHIAESLLASIAVPAGF